MKHRFSCGVAMVVVAIASTVASSAPSAGAVPASCPAAPVVQSGQNYVVTFGPGSTCWTVPDGVTAAKFVLAGASGQSIGLVNGGKGAALQAQLDVTPGTNLLLSVGAAGGSASVSNNTGGIGGNAQGSCPPNDPCTGLPGGRGGDGTFVATSAKVLIARGGGGGAGAPGFGFDMTCATSNSPGTRGLNGGNPNGTVPPRKAYTGAVGAVGSVGYCDDGLLHQLGGGGGGGGGYGGGRGGRSATWLPIDPKLSYDTGAQGGGGGTNYLDTTALVPGTTPADFGGVRTGDGYVSIIYARRGAGFRPIPPTRILDSRTQTGGWNSSPLVAGAPRSLVVAGAGAVGADGRPVGVPESAAAVVANVTVTDATAGSLLSVWPSGVAPPATSNLNFGPGQTIANLVTIKVGAGGAVEIGNAIGSVNVVVDLIGFYDDGGPGGALYTGIDPIRVLDSRTTTGGWTGALDASRTGDIPVSGPGSTTTVPVTATAVVVNVTVTNADSGSYLTMWPSQTPRPNSSSLNFAPHQTIANLGIVPIGSNGTISVATAVGQADVIVDVVGFFDPTSGSRFHPTVPIRLLDDRANIGLDGPWGRDQARTLNVSGRSGIPGAATGVVANVTATQATAGSFVSVYRSGVSRSGASNLNFGPGETIPNLVMTATGGNGGIDLYNQMGSVDLIADVVGYFAAN